MPTDPSDQPIAALRFALRPSDAPAIDELVRATAMFNAAECDVAMELVHENLRHGDACGYRFVVADLEERVAGYAAFGQIPCTLSSFDLYWIVVAPTFQGVGVGRRILRATEDAIRALGGTRLYVDTSGRAAYASTRRFYERCGYWQAAVLDDFYAPYDAKVVYARNIAG